ncbi:hypothetical protein POM88_051654 [Heracleum sosnowskyi]|uniref:Uncharacterized protein n=1 Tax=Heracleum sosnowskyi TaxID=360622 RepID=A0AAD8M3W9_9APIA|nr:hypothetical protein POM88_051654 [Heracleum sosnowskyi]
MRSVKRWSMKTSSLVIVEKEQCKHPQRPPKTYTPSSVSRRNLYTWEEKYPFIRYASSFSSSSSSTVVGKAYDYIILGGGTVGCPLAATLSKNFSVLLLERGGVPFTNRNVSKEAAIVNTVILNYDGLII